jgi:hypothetical protein
MTDHDSKYGAVDLQDPFEAFEAFEVATARWSQTAEALIRTLPAAEGGHVIRHHLRAMNGSADAALRHVLDREIDRP